MMQGPAPRRETNPPSSIAFISCLFFPRNNLGVWRNLNNDVENAVALFKAAIASSNHTLAMINLGSMYEKGRGVTQDDEEASVFYAKGCAQDHADAYHNLAGLFRAVRPAKSGTARNRT